MRSKLNVDTAFVSGKATKGNAVKTCWQVNEEKAIN